MRYFRESADERFREIVFTKKDILQIVRDSDDVTYEMIQTHPSLKPTETFDIYDFSYCFNNDATSDLEDGTVEIDNHVWKVLKSLGIEDEDTLIDCVNGEIDGELYDKIQRAYICAWFNTCLEAYRNIGTTYTKQELKWAINSFIEDFPMFELNFYKNLLDGFTLGVVGEIEDFGYNKSIKAEIIDEISNRLGLGKGGGGARESVSESDFDNDAFNSEFKRYLNKIRLAK